MTPDTPDELINGGDCPLHYHQSDRTPRQDTLHGLQLVTKVRSVSTSQPITSNDDIIVATADCTLTLPVAKGGREFIVKKYYAGGAGVVVARTGTDSIDGAASVTLTVTNAATQFKSYGIGYITI